MKQKFIDYFMNIAETTAELSYAERLQVGAVLVKDNQIIGTGYNGMPSGWDNVCEDPEWEADHAMWLDPDDYAEQFPHKQWHEKANREVRYRLKTKPEVLHAEMNCISKVARSTLSSAGATMFCTHAPCMDCAKFIYQAGVAELYYKHKYRSTNGLDFLVKCGIPVHQHTIQEQ
jgi:dCMP deaminase